MSDIIVNFSSIYITDYDMGDCRELEKHFQLWDKIRHKSYLSGVYYDEDNRILKIPRGIDIYYIERLLDTKAIYNKECDVYDKGVLNNNRIKFKPRDDNQKEAIRFMTASGEYNNLYKNTGLLLSLGTGKGKTYCSIVASIIRGYRTMMITSSINWLVQWKDCILDYCSNINRKEIYIISGTPTIYKLLNKPELIDKYKFFLVSDSTLKSYGDKYGWDKVHELFKLLRIGTKIFDECHLHFDTMCMIDFHSNTNMTYYLSATPLKSDNQENKIYQLYFKNIPSIELFDKEQDPHTNYVAIKFNSNPSLIEKSNCASAKYGLDRNKYIKYITGNENFYKLIRHLIQIIKDEKTLIFIGVNDSILKVYEWLCENYPSLSNDIGIYSTLIPVEERENNLKKQIILSTIKSTGTAKDIKGLKYVIVLADPFKSEVLTRQTLGRLRDNDTTYLDIVDLGFPQLNRYYRAKVPIFKKYALSLKEVILDQKTLDRV